MTTIKFHLKDDFTKQDLKLKVTLDGDSIDKYIEAINTFLLAAGFSESLVTKYLYGERNE